MTRSRVLIAGVALATAMGLGACSRGEEGAAEQVGQKIDAAAQGAADAAGTVKDGAAAAEQKVE